MNASSRAILERLVRADTASAFNISVGDVKVTGVTQVRLPSRRALSIGCGNSHVCVPACRQQARFIECNSMECEGACFMHALCAAPALHPGRASVRPRSHASIMRILEHYSFDRFCRVLNALLSILSKIAQRQNWELAGRELQTVNYPLEVVGGGKIQEAIQCEHSPSKGQHVRRWRGACCT